MNKVGGESAVFGVSSCGRDTYVCGFTITNVEMFCIGEK